MTAIIASSIFERASQSIAPESPVRLLRAQHDLDASVEDQARTELLAASRAIECDWLLLFLGQHVHVDTQGLTLLRDTAAHVRADGHRLAVVAPPMSLRHMVKVLDLGDEIPLVETPWDAVALIQAAIDGPETRSDS